MTYVAAADILANAGVPSPSAEDTAWAATCAAAIEARIADRLTGFTPSAGQVDELERAALLDGIAAYLERKSPHGIVTMGDAGEVARLGREIARALEPVFYRIAGPGIG